MNLVYGPVSAASALNSASAAAGLSRDSSFSSRSKRPVCVAFRSSNSVAVLCHNGFSLNTDKVITSIPRGCVHHGELSLRLVGL